MNNKLYGVSWFYLACVLSSHASEWNSFRGPSGMGIHSENLPVQWNNSNILWKKKISGKGQSSVVQAGTKIFVTSAKENNSRLLYCLNKENGDVLWEREISNKREEPIHRMNGWATPTPATDGNHVVAFFGPAGLHCFDLEGKKKWSLDLGEFPGNWGVAASPIIQNGMVIQNCDAIGSSRLVAVNVSTGKIIWDTPRSDKPKGGWSSPIVISVEGKKQIVLNGEFGPKGYSFENGKELWFCESFNGRGSPVPFYNGQLLFVVNGKPGDLYAVDPTGRGNITRTHMKWHARRNGGRDLPSPACVNDLVMVTSMSGIITCYDAKSGKTHWVDRLEGAFAAAPLVTTNYYYIQNEEGITYVIKPNKDKLQVISKNLLSTGPDDIFRSTLSPIDKRIYSRSHTTLFCIKASITKD